MGRPVRYNLITGSRKGEIVTLLERERNAVVEYGRRLVERGLTRDTGGNVSVLSRERRLFAVSPSGMDYFETRPEDVVVLDMEGNVADGARRPSSEVEMHRLLYLEREDVGAVVHTHSVYATAVSCTREAQAGGLPPVHCAAALAGGDVRCTAYYPFGTRELAEAACEGMRGRFAVLLGNHGVLAAGSDVGHAFALAEQLEFACEVLVHAASVGTPALLSSSDLLAARERFRDYGQGRRE